MAASDPDPPGDVYFEITRIGSVAKVSAIDAATGLEVSVAGPAAAAEASLKQLALAKLRRRMAAARTPRPDD